MKDTNKILNQKSFSEIMKEIMVEKYGETIVNMGENPENYGPLDCWNGYTSYTGACGDTMEIWLNIIEGEIVNIGFLTNGCTCTRATGSFLTEKVKNKKIQDAIMITPLQIDKELGGLPEDHKHCASLAKNTLIKAILNYKGD